MKNKGGKTNLQKRRDKWGQKKNEIRVNMKGHSAHIVSQLSAKSEGKKFRELDEILKDDDDSTS